MMMTSEEAIKVLSSYDVNGVWADVDGKPYDAEEQAEAFDMAIEALKHERTDEWCTDCKEYDTEKKCCPRFNRVIRGAMNREPSEDGTLEVKVEDATKIGRVLITDDKHRGGLYYPDEDEPQGDLISRADAIRVVEKNSYRMPGLTELKLKIEMEALPSADRPTDGDLISRADAIEALGEEPPVWCDEDYEIAERDQWRADIEAIESVPSADRPRDDFDGMIFSTDKYMAFIDKKDIHIMRKGTHKITVERMFNTEGGEYKPMPNHDRDWIVGCIKHDGFVKTDRGDKANQIILDALSADQPRGEWLESREQNILMAKRIEKGETWRVCSNCGTGFMIGAQYEGQKCYGERFHNFCPRCGADMRGGERSKE